MTSAVGGMRYAKTNAAARPTRGVRHGASARSEAAAAFAIRPFAVRPFAVRPFAVRPFAVRPFASTDVSRSDAAFRSRRLASSRTRDAAAAAASEKHPASATHVLAAAAARSGTLNAVATRLPALRTIMPRAWARMDRFGSPAEIWTRAPSAPVSQMEKKTTERTPATQSADVDDARETLAGGGVGHRAEDHVRHPA